MIQKIMAWAGSAGVFLLTVSPGIVLAAQIPVLSAVDASPIPQDILSVGGGVGLFAMGIWFAAQTYRSIKASPSTGANIERLREIDGQLITLIKAQGEALRSIASGLADIQRSLAHRDVIDERITQHQATFLRILTDHDTRINATLAEIQRNLLFNTRSRSSGSER